MSDTPGPEVGHAAGRMGPAGGAAVDDAGGPAGTGRERGPHSDAQDGASGHGRRASAGGRLVAGVPLLALAGALAVVVATGDNLLYVRPSMTLPLVAAAVVLGLLGLAALVGVASPGHTPRSVLAIAAPLVLLLVVRPGPLTVDTGRAFDRDGGGLVDTSVVIPSSAIVGEHATAGRIDAAAFEMDQGQIAYAALQLPDQLPKVAIRVVGQLDVGDDGVAHVVRFRIICCAADALRMATPIDDTHGLAHGDWVSVSGQWDGDPDDPGLHVAVMASIARPDNPYLLL